MCVGRSGSPLVERVHVYAVRTHQADAVNDDTLGLSGFCHRCGRRSNGSFAVGEHDNDLRVGGCGVEQRVGAGEGVSVVGVAPSGEGVHGGFQSAHIGDELGVYSSSAGKADNADAAAVSDLAGGGATSGVGDDVDEGFGPQVCQGIALHAAGTVQSQDDVSGVGDNIRRCGQGQCDQQRAIASDLVRADGFVGVGYTHMISSF